MTIPNCKSSVIGGFLDTLTDLTRDNPEARNAVSQARQDLAGEFEPDLEEGRREALAQWATHRWAPICLRLAGFDRTAELLTQSADSEAAADVLNDLSVAVPPDPNGDPRSLDEVAGRAAWGAGTAGMRINQSIGPAFAVKMTDEATRRSHAAGMCPRRLHIADEAIKAATQAMAGHGPENADI